MRNGILAAAVLAGLALTATAPSALADTAQKKVWVCKDVKQSNNKGTIVGAAGGALLGNVVAGHGHKTAGTLLGAGVGAVAGHEVAKNNNAKNPKQDCHYEYR